MEIEKENHDINFCKIREGRGDSDILCPKRKAGTPHKAARQSS